MDSEFSSSSAERQGSKNYTTQGEQARKTSSRLLRKGREAKGGRVLKGCHELVKTYGRTLEAGLSEGVWRTDRELFPKL